VASESEGLESGFIVLGKALRRGGGQESLWYELIRTIEVVERAICWILIDSDKSLRYNIISEHELPEGRRDSPW
jgi:hypothetical protein